MRTRAILVDGVGQLLERFGYRISKDASARRAAMMQALDVDTVLDAGANIGQYARRVRSAGYRGPIVSFEPLSGAFGELFAAASSDGEWDVHHVALSDHDGEAEINISHLDTWSSLLPRDDQAVAPQLAYVATERVKTAQLDSLDALRGARRAWLKSDVQGFELRVLAGAHNTLRHVVAVECEIVLEPLYAGQPSARQTVDYLDDRGFRLAAVDSGERRDTGRAVWIDAVFTRD